jgi:geranyl-CoA carboxylase alpha subunit
VRAADQAVCIGEPLPAQSYLDVEAILAAARATGADAVHPGYGFLAENARFARACRDAGLVFIGPSPEAIEAMGDKAGAKRRMAAAGVPCIPGYEGDEQTEQRLGDEARRIGYPVMIKAAAGGGGRGMRLVTQPDAFAESLRSARSEAEHAFGDTTVILERAIVEPRHVEIQVLADRHGHVLHLGERDCSVQRRHQKLIEETPSPAVGPELRARMGATAVAAAKAIGYEGAGTLEFLLDREGRFWFMEMNTRLQVEHPVTEAVTGLDLVALQLSIAAGEPLPLRQEDVRAGGHAIEVRLCAEDPAHGFLPQSGRLARWETPPRLRVEHALESGIEIPPYYDSMIAKLVAHGATREDARRKLLAGLEDTVALGIATNQAFLARCLAHPAFVAGDATTAFVGAQQDALLAPDPEAEQRTAAIAAMLLVETAAAASPHAADRRLPHALRVDLRYRVGSTLHTAGLVDRGGHHAVTLAGREHVLEFLELADGRARFVCDGVVERAVVLRDGPRLLLHYRGRPFEVHDTTHAAAAFLESANGADGRLRASMNGRVVAVLVAEGALVDAGQPVFTLEAMKMEHVHAAPVRGRVRALRVSVGEQVAAGRVAAEIEAESEPPARPRAAAA